MTGPFPRLVDDSTSVAVFLGGLSEHVVKAKLVGVLLYAGVPLLNQLHGFQAGSPGVPC